MGCLLVLGFVHDSDTHCCILPFEPFLGVSLRLSSLLVHPRGFPLLHLPSLRLGVSIAIV